MKARRSPSSGIAAASRRSAELRQALLEHRRDIDASVRATLADARDARADARPARPRDDGEVDDVDATDGVEFGLVALKVETLSRIDEALARLEAGTYGCCVDCGGDIPAARLRALPFAVRCVGCQEATELAAPREGVSLRRRAHSPGFAREDWPDAG